MSDINKLDAIVGRFISASDEARNTFIDDLRADNRRLRAVIVRAKDALLDGQSTQWVHDVLVAALTDEKEGGE